MKLSNKFMRSNKIKLSSMKRTLNLKRTIVTYANKKVESMVESMAKTSPYLKKDLQVLKQSPRTYPIKEIKKGRANFNPINQTIEIPTSSWNVKEMVPHEVHHGAQYESIYSEFGADIAQQIFDNPIHRTAMEKSALATGKTSVYSDSVVLRKMVDDHWKHYETIPGYGSLDDASKMLRNSKFHSYSRKRLKDIDRI